MDNITVPASLTDVVSDIRQIGERSFEVVSILGNAGTITLGTPSRYSIADPAFLDLFGSPNQMDTIGTMIQFELQKTVTR